jgi:hypothetical protein
MLSVEVADPPPGETEAGEKVAVAPGGNPLAENETLPGNVPFFAATVMEYLAEPPGGTVCAPVVDETVKLGAARPVPVRVGRWPGHSIGNGPLCPIHP